MKILDINYNHFYHSGKSQVLAGACYYFRPSKPHSGTLWGVLNATSAICPPSSEFPMSYASIYLRSVKLRLMLILLIVYWQVDSNKVDKYLARLDCACSELTRLERRQLSEAELAHNQDSSRRVPRAGHVTPSRLLIGWHVPGPGSWLAGGCCWSPAWAQWKCRGGVQHKYVTI